MYGFLYAVEDETHLSVRPFSEVELFSIEGTPDQVEQFRDMLEHTDLSQDPIVVQFDKDTLILEEEKREEEHGLLLG